MDKEKLREKEGSLEINIPEKKVFQISGVILFLLIGWIWGKTAGIILLTIITGTGYGFWKIFQKIGENRIDEGGTLKTVINGFTLILMAPVYPFKKMLDYRDLNLEETEGEQV